MAKGKGAQRAKTAAGMQMRRPRRRSPSEDEVRALEAKAEQLASKEPGSAPATPAPRPEPVQAANSPKKRPRKVQITAYLPPDVRDELNRAAVALSGPPRHESVTSIVERAIRAELERLEEEHGPFPETDRRPRRGRRPAR